MKGTAMRALRLHAPRDFRIHDEAVLEPLAGEVLIQIKSVGVCASDIHYYTDGGIGTTRITKPMVIGHEASGIIAGLGEGVSNLAVGDRVAIEPAKPCMKCEYCLSGNYNVCPGIPFFGTPPTDGCLRDFITWPASLVLKVPDSLGFDEAAMVEPLAIGAYAIELAESKSNDTIGILGMGAVGLSVLQAAKITGIGRAIVIEPVEARRNLASFLGADEVIDPSACDAVQAVDALTKGRGLDIVFECAGEDQTVRESCRLARVLGKTLIIGIPVSDDYSLDASTARRKQLTALFVRRSNLTTEKSIEWVAQSKANVSCYATHHFQLEDSARAFELAATKEDGVIRAMITVND
jgi:L-iditol 2-dehydrogenase